MTTRVAIDVGDILDKYELIEKVGQGGMAVVYRGLDRTLQREVAIKILHTHLADYQEARDRFAREARAVAKLRHDNILEIYDFSGGESDSSYIVTEFIEGETLKEMISARAFAYPEIGAMVMVDVCRALSHAHQLGVLHRDVKPENIMIRRDGVVKLMDFGIAQMLDMQRLTVTGQLLGSPAYMAPEHVTGDQLDFRTDVFAVGIVLYQLATGELPFQGNNPHELLKRIAEGVYRDSRQVEPLVSKSLGSIIQRALERDPDARFATAADMQAALERYLVDECGLADHRRELATFFADPNRYEDALGERLTQHLAARGKELVRDQPVAALECFNRVLTLDPTREDVLEVMERISRRRRLWRSIAVSGVVALLAVAAFAALRSRDAAPDEPAERALTQGPGDEALVAMSGTRKASDAGPAPSRDEDAYPGVAVASGRGDAGVDVDAPSNHQHDERDPDARRPVRPRVPRAQSTDANPDEAATDTVTSRRRFVLKVAQKRSEYRVDQGPWTPVDKEATFEVSEGAHMIEVQNAACCQNESRRIGASEPGGVISMDLGYMPATITPRCNAKGVLVQLNDRPADLGQANVVVMRSGLGVEKVRVTFIGERIDTHTVTVRYKEHLEVKCGL